MAEPEKKKLIDTPEFKTAVAEAVDAALAKLVPELDAARKAAGTENAADVGGDQNFMRQLAMAIAEISDQGTHRKRVAPEILAKRNAARDLMGQLILEARAKGEEPEYRLIGEVYLGEARIAPFTVDPATKRPVPVEIGWTGPPNECMRPLNDSAFGIFSAFMESIGGNTEGTDWRPEDGTAAGKSSAHLNSAWVTERGLYIKGASGAQRRTVGSLPDSNAPGPSDKVKIHGAHGAHDPRASHVHVLGTVAAPARQNPLGETPATAVR